MSASDVDQSSGDEYTDPNSFASEDEDEPSARAGAALRATRKAKKGSDVRPRGHADDDADDSVAKGAERLLGDDDDDDDNVDEALGGSVIISKVRPLHISFKNLAYAVKVRKTRNPFHKKYTKYLLKDLHGDFTPGQVTAIMGPSGAGKTTLLNILAGRMQGGKCKGEILVNGRDMSKIGTRRWRRLTAYVMQDDVMHGNLTPEETLAFSAGLRLAGLNLAKMRERVAALVEELGLEACKKTRIGTPEKRGISGGQRKRVAIGLDMITDPRVLFLDEPTTGLDSSTAYALTLTLRKLAASGRTIITTIHQPSTDMFMKFHRVMLLTHGHIAYHGPTSEVVPYFSKLNYKCPRYTNPAEFIMDIAKLDSHISTKEEGKKRIQKFVENYRLSQGLSRWNVYGISKSKDKLVDVDDVDIYDDDEDVDETEEEEDDDEDEKGKGKGKGTAKTSGKSEATKQNEEYDSLTDEEEPPGPITRIATSWKKSSGKGNSTKAPPQPNFFVRLFLLLIRAVITNVREPLKTYARLIQALYMALLIGFIYLQIGDDQESVQDRQGSLFFIAINMIMMSVMNTVVTFPAERVVYIREHSNGAYSTLCYYIAKVIADSPMQFIFPAIGSAVMYWMVGFDAQADKFFIFLATNIAVSHVAYALGLLISAGSPNVAVANVFMTLVLIPLMLFGGLFINLDSIPDWLLWAKYISPFKYAFEILVLNEFDGLTFTCKESEKKGGQCPISTGRQAIEDLSFDEPEINIWSGFLFLLALYVLYITLGYFALRFTAGRKRG